MSAPRSWVCKQTVISLTWVLALSFGGWSAWAKPVKLRWQEEQGAIQYELQIERQGKVVKTEILHDTEWKGELDFGVYSYQIRAYDRVKRPGAWSPASALVVMPQAPKALSPEDGAKTAFYTKTGSIDLKWDAVPGASRYAVELSRDGQLVHSETVRATELKLPDLEGGKYSWKVAAVFDAQDRAPASLHGRRWEGKFSDASEFKLKQEQLEAPVLRSPEGVIPPPKGGELHLRWKPVDGAVAYEVIVLKKVSLDRAPAGALASRFITPNTDLVVQVAGEGEYTWQVRAIASYSQGAIESHASDIVSDRSSAQFKIDRNAGYVNGSGYFAVSTMIAPYNYKVSSDETNNVPLSASSAETALRLSGEYWIASQNGVGADFDNRFYSLGGQSFDDKDLALAWKYRTNLDSGEHPWMLQPELGYEMRQYSYIIPLSSGSGIKGSQQLSSNGPVVGFDLRKQISTKLSLGGSFRYYYPISLDQGLSVAHGQSQSNRNVSVGLQGLYWWDQQWGAGFGVFLDDRSIAATSANGGGYIQMDGTYFFGSLVWRFGK